MNFSTWIKAFSLLVTLFCFLNPVAAQIESRNVTTFSGKNWSFLEAGKGKSDPIILLHGIPEAAFSWEHYLNKMADKFHVIALDLPGLSNTYTPSTVPDYAPVPIAKQIIELIKHLGYSRYFIVGHDYGGSIAYVMSYLSQIDHPQMKGLIIISAPNPCTLSREYYSETSDQRQKLIYLEKYGSGEFGRWSYLKQIFSNKKSVDYYKDIDVFFNYLFHWINIRNLDTYVKYYRSIFPIARPEQVIFNGCKSNIPNLVLWSDTDEFLSQRLLNGLEEINPNVIIKRHSKAGHFLHHEKPEMVLEEIEAFVIQNNISINK